MGWWKCLVCCWSYFFGSRSVSLTGQGPYRTAAPLPVEQQAEPSDQPVTRLVWQRPVIVGACLSLGVITPVGSSRLKADAPFPRPSASRPRVECLSLVRAQVCSIHDPPCVPVRDRDPFLGQMYDPALRSLYIMACGPFYHRGDLFLLYPDHPAVCHP